MKTRWKLSTYNDMLVLSEKHINDLLGVLIVYTSKLFAPLYVLK